MVVGKILVYVIVIVVMIMIVIVIVIVVMVMVMVMVVIVTVVPSADCSCLSLAFSDQSGSRRPGGFLPCRTGLLRAAVFSLASLIWFYHQLGAVHRRGVDLLSRCPCRCRRRLLVEQVVVAVLIFGHFRGLWQLSGL